MTDNTYEGWTNQQTWRVNLEMSNEESTYRTWTSVAADNLANGSDEHRLKSLMSESYEAHADWHKTGETFEGVNWLEIAKCWHDTAVEEAARETA